MKSAKGKFCGDFPKPKEPFVAQPFFGNYARTGGKDEQATSSRARPAARDRQPGDTPDGQRPGHDGQGRRRHADPPDAYETPPQQAPTRRQPAAGDAAGGEPGRRRPGTAARARPTPG